jgi:hypothetical protein
VPSAEAQNSIFNTTLKTRKIVYHDYSDNLYMMIYNFASVSVVLNIEY